MHTTVEAIYAIRCKATGEYVRANFKSSWMSKSTASRAIKWLPNWNEDYEVVDLLGSYQYMKDNFSAAHEMIDKLLVKNIELEQQVASLEDRLRAALVYPMDKR